MLPKSVVFKPQDWVQDYFPFLKKRERESLFKFYIEPKWLLLFYFVFKNWSPEVEQGKGLQLKTWISWLFNKSLGKSYAQLYNANMKESVNILFSSFQFRPSE